jgi:hypothetical protein
MVLNTLLIIKKLKEYTDDALDNDEYDKKNDQIDLLEKNYMLILMYIHMMNLDYYKSTED